MAEILKAGGVPILLCSVLSIAIVVERFWSLQKNKIMPRHLVTRIFIWPKKPAELMLDNPQLPFLLGK